MANKEEAPMSPSHVLQFATEQLHAVRPQPPAEQIAMALNTLKATLASAKAGKKEEPPKDVHEAVARIQAKIAKMDPPLEEKVDLAACFPKEEQPAAGKSAKSA